MYASRYGLTVAEVLVAVVILTVGVLALVGSSAQVSRMIGRGRQATVAAMIGAGRVERLRRIALSTSPPCMSPEWRSGSAVGPRVTESWHILDPSGLVRRLQVIVQHRTPSGVATDTVATALLCGPV